MRDTLTRLFDLDDHPLHFGQAAELRPAPAGMRLWQVRAETREGGPVRSFWIRPEPGDHVLAVLVIHAHGGSYQMGADELIDGRPALAAPPGPALSAMGVASLCLVLPCFGLRQNPGESAHAKAALWDGRSLAGQTLSECHAVLGWLAARPKVLPARIGVFGFSMDCTLGYWLAAVDTQVRAVVQEGCLAEFPGPDCQRRA